MLLMSVRRHFKKLRRTAFIQQDGAQGRNRTTDTVIFSHVLYQLSYLGIRGWAGRPAGEPAPYRSPSSLSTLSGSAAGPGMR